MIIIVWFSTQMKGHLTCCAHESCIGLKEFCMTLKSHGARSLHFCKLFLNIPYFFTITFRDYPSTRDAASSSHCDKEFFNYQPVPILSVDFVYWLTISVALSMRSRAMAFW